MKKVFYKLIIGILILFLLWFLETFGTQLIPSKPKIGEKGFELKISCIVRNYDIVSGSYRNHEVALGPCLDVDGTAKVTTLNGSQIYTLIDLMRNRGRINVPQHFSFAAYNKSDYMILNLEVFDSATGKLIYTDQAGQYDVVSASN